ncbi:MAG TPA: sugar transferase [Pirellulales bacterium]|nr:sugar transferase [Pirellulales bacterium]
MASTKARAEGAKSLPLRRRALFAKRAFDIVCSLLGLLILAPVLLVVAVLVKLSSRGPIFYRQQRVGRDFVPFGIYKFRSMVVNADRQGVLLTAGRDPRITRIGAFLRRSKLDELPQLLNVLKGDMSLVGPRPEVAQYVEQFHADYEDLLRVRPGITDLASLEYRDEADVLGHSADPEREYIETILPRKIALSRAYLRDVSLGHDLRIIGRTIRKVFSH